MIQFIGKVLSINNNESLKEQCPEVIFDFTDFQRLRPETLYIAKYLELKAERKKGQKGRSKIHKGIFDVGIDIKSIRIWTDPTALWRITDEDAQGYAQSIFDLARPLTDDELHSIKKGCEWGFGDAKDDVLGTAVREAVELDAVLDSSEPDEDSFDSEEENLKKRIKDCLKKRFKIESELGIHNATLDIINQVDEDFLHNCSENELINEIEKLGYKRKEK